MSRTQAHQLPPGDALGAVVYGTSHDGLDNRQIVGGEPRGFGTLDENARLLLSQMPLPMQQRVFYQEFTHAGLDDWALTLLGAGGTMEQTAAAEMHLYGGAPDNSFVNVAQAQAKQPVLILRQGLPMSFAAGMTFPNRYGTRFVAGLQVLGQPPINREAGIFVWRHGASDGWRMVLSPSAGSPEVDVGVAVSPSYGPASDRIDLGFSYDGDRTLTFSVNGARAEVSSDDIFAALPFGLALSPEFSVTGNVTDGGPAERSNVYIDYVYVAQLRTLRL